MSRFHLDLTRARFVPKAVVGPRTYRLARIGSRLQRGARDVEVVEVAPGVTARIHRPPGGNPTPGGLPPLSGETTPHPPGSTAPAVLYLHGGGSVIGSATLGDRFCARLARHLGVVVAAVDYRLAPEHPYPTPLHDAHAALRWLAAQPEVDAQRIALVGESAGGGLAAALALHVRDVGELRPVLQVLSYPMLDDRTTHGGLDPAVLRLWSQRSNRFGWDAYLGQLAGGHVPATAVPARAADLAGLPATWIGVGTNDLFHAEDVAWARRLDAAGVRYELLEVDRAYHGFDAVEPGAAVSRAFLRARLAALREAFAG